MSASRTRSPIVPRRQRDAVFPLGILELVGQDHELGMEEFEFVVWNGDRERGTETGANRSDERALDRTSESRSCQ